MTRVLFVCSGNICRSPTAEGVLRDRLARAGLDDRVEVDSAGIGAWHVGQPPDGRSHEAASRRGIDLTGQCARPIAAEDFHRFDLLIAMDRGHLAELRRLCPEDEAHRVRLFLDFAPHCGTRDVPDPYYGGEDGFDRVLDLIEAGVEGLIATLEPDAR